MRTKYIYFLLAFLLTGLAACKKTIDYQPLEQNRIIEYKVVNLQDTVIYGSIDNIQNTITVYVPYYYAMDVIQPKITLDPNATLSTPAVPVSVTDQSQTYTVKGADGTTRLYKLIITQQNPPGLKLQYLTAPPTNIPGGELDITGNFLSTSTATLKITLQSATSNTLTNMDITQAQIVTYPSDNNYLMVAHTPITLDSGYYKVNVSYLGNSVTMDQPVHVYYPTPVIATTYGTQTLAAGDSLKFLVAAPNFFHDLKSVTVTIKGQIYNIPVKSFSLVQAVITIPDTLPIGNWGSVPFIFQFGNFKPVTTSVQLVVKAKTG